MAEQHPVPQQPLRLRLLRGATDTPAGAATGGDTDLTPVAAPVSAEVVPVSAARRAGVALRYRAGTVASAAQELWLHPDRLGHALWHGRPESAAEHFAYMKSRAWVPPEMTGRKAAFITWAGFAYHVLIAWPLKSAAKLIDAAASRPLRLLALLLPCLAVFLIVSGNL